MANGTKIEENTTRLQHIIKKYNPIRDKYGINSFSETKTTSMRTQHDL